MPMLWGLVSGLGFLVGLFAGGWWCLVGFCYWGKGCFGFWLVGLVFVCLVFFFN